MLWVLIPLEAFVGVSGKIMWLVHNTDSIKGSYLHFCKELNCDEQMKQALGRCSVSPRYYSGSESKARKATCNRFLEQRQVREVSGAAGRVSGWAGQPASPSRKPLSANRGWNSPRPCLQLGRLTPSHSSLRPPAQ